IEIKKDEPSAQSFRHGASGNASYSISKITFRISRKPAQNNNVNFSISTLSGTIPGTAYTIAMATITNTSGGSSFQDYTIVYNRPVGPFTAGTTYFLSFNNSPSGKEVYLERSSGNSYSRGTSYKGGSDEGKDLRFEIHEPITSAIATVTFNVTPVDNAPVAINDSTNVLEDSSIAINVLGNDIEHDGDALAITAVSASNGTVSVSGTGIVFTPATNFNGPATVGYTISDGTFSATGLVAISVLPVNDLPVARDDATNTMENVSVTVPVLSNDSDADNDALSIMGCVATNGTAIVSGANIVFTPAAGFSGIARLSYTITDGTASATALAVIVVTSVNNLPVAVGDSYITSENSPLAIPAPGVLANDSDADGGKLSAVLVSSAAHGSVTLNADGSFTYTPESNYFGADSFTYRASDGEGQSVIATVALTTTLTQQLKIYPTGVVSNGFKLRVSGPAAAVYTILASSNHTDWVPIGTNVALTGEIEFLDTNAHNSSLCFYQARVGTQAMTVLQENSSRGHSIDIQLGQQGAQSFRYRTSGGPSYSVSKIVFHLSRTATLPNAPLQLSIGTGLNSGALAGSGIAIDPLTITNTTSGATFQVCEIVYQSPVVLSAGTIYYLNLACEAPNGGRIYIESSGFSSAYPAGTYYQDGSNKGEDAWFQIGGQ
ncbi:MAG TPA: cadherin-like domain-containing protein, partial [Candidatus Acidoferrum sp.]|nr:cadherin-like domain-containing protein [Candidatus Acidoferrum sp.]